MSVGVTIVAGHERSAAHVGGGGARVRLVDNTTGTWNRGHEKILKCGGSRSKDIGNLVSI